MVEWLLADKQLEKPSRIRLFPETILEHCYRACKRMEGSRKTGEGANRSCQKIEEEFGRPTIGTLVPMMPLIRG